MAKWDSRNLEIRSKSVEQTLIPLVTQITTLVNHKDRCKRTEKGRQAIREVGEVVKNAVLKFVTVGEQIARENEDVAAEMQQACEEARKAGEVISRLTSTTSMAVEGSEDGIPFEKTGMVRGARSLLSAVTRVLIIADSVVIKRLLKVVNKVDERIEKLETVNSFTEFVQTFSQFGAEMVELAHISGDRQNDLKDDVLRAEMCCARSILEKSTMMLLTTSKTCLRHPGSMVAKTNRDGVFTRMKEAVTTIRDVTEDKCKSKNNKEPCLAMDIKHFENSLDKFRKSTPGETEAKVNFQKGLEKIILDVQPFVDSTHTCTRKEKRENIIALCENAQDIMKDIIERHTENEVPAQRSSSADSLDLALQRIFKISADLKHEVHQVAMDQVFETFSHQGHKKSLPGLRHAAATGDHNNIEQAASAFLQDGKRLEEVSKVTRNMCTSEAVSITARRIEENIKTLCPQVVAAARTLASHPVSKIAQENMDVFIDIWEGQVEELGKVLRGITSGGEMSKKDQNNNEIHDGEKHQPQLEQEQSRIDKMLNKKWESQISYPTPLYGANIRTTFVTRKYDVKVGRLVSNVNLMTSQLELNDLPDVDNDILQRAIDVSHMVCELYLFTRGEGRLLCTTDYFEAAQTLAEAGKALWKVARQQAIKVEDNEPKRELMRYCDKLLAHCQQLMFTSSSLSVGQAALYRKVFAVMNLTKTIIKIVGRVVNRCYLVTEKNSPLRPPPDQRLWRIDENIFSDASSANTSRKSSLQSLDNAILDWLSEEDDVEAAKTEL